MSKISNHRSGQITPEKITHKWADLQSTNVQLAGRKSAHCSLSSSQIVALHLDGPVRIGAPGEKGQRACQEACHKRARRAVVVKLGPIFQLDDARADHGPKLAICLEGNQL